MRSARLAVAFLALVCPTFANDPLQPREAPPSPDLSWVAERSIPELQDALASGKLTSVRLVELYLHRIALYNPILRAALAVSPTALAEAAELDRERQQGKVRGPLHGIPIALKDNIQVRGMPTTGGALAFEGFEAPYEATLAHNLRQAGAILLAKTQMTELANWVAVGMPTNYSALGGFGFNPYDPRRDPRPEPGDGRPILMTGGSSSGTGTAASLWAANVGTETSGSILSPAGQNALVGLKPTVGRISRHGIIPITADQDTAGPMGRTVEDAAILFGALEGTHPDPQDAATGRCPRPEGGDYTRFLDARALRGARIGVPRAFFVEPLKLPGDAEPRGGLDPERKRVFEEAVGWLRALGAVILDPADLPSVVDPDPDRNLLRWPICHGYGDAKGQDADCSIVFKYGMKRDFNRWLESLGPAAPVRTLTELRKFNLERQKAGAIRYGQALLDISDEMDVEADRDRYERDRAKDLELAGRHGLDAVFERHQLDAVVFPANFGAGVAARPGYPSILVPAGWFVPKIEGLAAGFDPQPSPFGITFTGPACSEPRLLALAFAFEQATRARRPPPANFP